ncbi:unnamed protein product [Ostreobium quekettii]|uniref:HP domain-containing protein n=1 Tax=Ostreobium quekettii TaxID=121088 RepID=A0A8S1J281_9CHLO|nr:unnamed protein product [Ostreobium quekettii]|eukprot:evm.model.scf_238EXC.8 EVM.evm.TU.scf_238EXC.8   scf_238EXC:71484-73604(-)
MTPSSEDIPDGATAEEGASGLSREATSVPSLQECCMKTVNRCLNARSVLELLEFCQMTGGMFAQGPELKNKCMQFVTNTFESVRQIMGDEALRRILPEEVTARLEEAAKERAETIRKVRIEGKVVEREALGEEPKEENLGPSVSGEVAHRYDNLRAGVRWPSNVDPTRREEYLTEEEFKKVFWCSYSEYQQYPQWKQLWLKKEKELF